MIENEEQVAVVEKHDGVAEETVTEESREEPMAEADDPMADVRKEVDEVKDIEEQMTTTGEPIEGVEEQMTNKEKQMGDLEESMAAEAVQMAKGEKQLAEDKELISKGEEQMVIEEEDQVDGPVADVRKEVDEVADVQEQPTNKAGKVESVPVEAIQMGKGEKQMVEEKEEISKGEEKMAEKEQITNGEEKMKNDEEQITQEENQRKSGKDEIVNGKGQIENDKEQTENGDDQMLKSTTAESAEIKAIAKDTVHKICSGQVVLTLAVAVKELVENSIDAGATLIEVKLKEQGLESVEVSDNGSGVHERDLQAMTAKYHTSKIREFLDLQNVETFGFRGEALSSLCALCDLVVVTRHGSVDVGTRIELDHEGTIRKRTPCARSVGTTVTFTNLFVTLPVRRRDFVRNVRKEFNKMCQILQAYCLVTRGVRIICSNQNAKGAKMVVMQTNGSQDILANIGAVFGHKQSAELLPLKSPYSEEQQLSEESLRAELQLDTTAADSSMQITAEDVEQLKSAQFQLEGFVSSCNHGAGRSSKDRQYFYINSRPCDPKNISKIVNETYHRYNGQQYPFVYLNINTTRADVDVNLTPDKRQLLLNNEKILLIAIKKAMLNTYGNIPSTYKLQNSTIASMQEKNKKLGKNNNEDDESGELVPISSSQRFMDVLSQWKKTGDTLGKAPRASAKRKRPDEVETRTQKLKKIHDYLNRETLSQPAMPKEFRVNSDSDEDESNSNLNEKHTLDNTAFDLERLGKESKEFDSLTGFVVQRIDCKVTSTATKSAPSLHFIENISSNNSNSEASCSNTPVDDYLVIPEPSGSPSVILDDSTTDATSTANFFSSGIMRLTLEEISNRIKEEEKLRAANRAASKVKLERLRFKSEINPSQNQRAEEELEREISKDTFAKMEIIGQFNLGFIIVKLDTDLFIIDQHATDEKYNFETLQRTTVLQSQPLAVPQLLELTAVNEMLLLDNLELFEKNGFKFAIDENAPPTKKIRLLCKPSSQRWEFGKEDIDELLFMLQDAPSGTVCRPSRIRDMFASRACRKSVMIGTALNKSTMKKLVTHMGEIEQPWNCPHGRPTMRHLINIAMLQDKGEEDDDV